MSATGVNRRRLGGEDRFYRPPEMRKYNQQQQQIQSRTKTTSLAESEKRIESDDGATSSTTSLAESEKRIESDDGATSSTTSLASRTTVISTNLDRFLEHATPKVPAQYFPKTSMRGWRNKDGEFHPYFILGDLWESLSEWSAYGAGVPLVLDGGDSVVQYYVPFLSGIQLYIDPSKISLGQRRSSEDSDADSFRETSSNDSSGRGPNDAVVQGFNQLSMGNNTFKEPTDEGEVSTPPGLLVFQYLEHVQPFGREPLADKILALAAEFPELKTFRSCDLMPASWISVAWYPIYRIPTGPTLHNVDACFLTYHSLSTPLRSTSPDGIHSSTTNRMMNSTDVPVKLSLPIFGLATYKYQVSIWNSNGAYECQKANSLLRAADNWLRLLQVNHPDYRFFVSHNSYWR